MAISTVGLWAAFEAVSALFFARVSSGLALIANAAIRHPGDQPEDGFWVDDRDPTEQVMRDPANHEDYTPA